MSGVNEGPGGNAAGGTGDTGGMGAGTGAVMAHELKRGG